MNLISMLKDSGVRRKLRLTRVRVLSQIVFFLLFVLAVWATWTTRLG